MHRFEQPRNLELQRLEPLGRDLAVVSGGHRTHRNDPEQRPGMPAKLQPVMLPDCRDSTAFVADEFSASRVRSPST